MAVDSMGQSRDDVLAAFDALICHGAGRAGRLPRRVMVIPDSVYLLAWWLNEVAQPVSIIALAVGWLVKTWKR